MVYLQNRFKSKVLWVSLATQVLAMLMTLGVINVTTSDILNTIIVSICELFVAFGILNNPTDSERL